MRRERAPKRKRSRGEADGAIIGAASKIMTGHSVAAIILSSAALGVAAYAAMGESQGTQMNALFLPIILAAIGIALSIYGVFLVKTDESADQGAATTVQPQGDERTAIFVKADGQLRKVEFADIRYVEGMKDYVLLHLLSEKRPIVTHITMKAVEELLPAATFMRVHRSYIVALDKIDSVTGTYDISVGDTFIHVSDAYKSAFEQYLSQRMLR